MRFILTSALPLSVENVEPISNLHGEIRLAVAAPGDELEVLTREVRDEREGYLVHIKASSPKMHGGSFCPSGVITFVTDHRLGFAARQID